MTVFSQDNNPWAEQQEPLIFFQREKRILNYTDGILNIRTVRSKRIRRNDINIGPPAPPQTHVNIKNWGVWRDYEGGADLLK